MNQTNTPEDIEKYKEDRRKRFPTKEVVTQKEQEKQARIERGELLDIPQFDPFKGGRRGGRGRWGRGRGGGRGGRGRRGWGPRGGREHTVPSSQPNPPGEEKSTDGTLRNSEEIVLDSDNAAEEDDPRVLVFLSTETINSRAKISEITGSSEPSGEASGDNNTQNSKHSGISDTSMDKAPQDSESTKTEVPGSTSTEIPNIVPTMSETPKITEPVYPKESGPIQLSSEPAHLQTKSDTSETSKHNSATSTESKVAPDTVPNNDKAHKVLLECIHYIASHGYLQST